MATTGIMNLGLWLGLLAGIRGETVTSPSAAAITVEEQERSLADARALFGCVLLELKPRPNGVP